MAIYRTDIDQSSSEEKTNYQPSSGLIRNALLLGSLWVAYAAVRGLTAGDFATAANNAEAIISLQHNLGLPSEATLQQAVLGYTWLIKAANFYYLLAHFPITIAFLVWTWRNHRSKFGRVRNALIATTGVGLAVHLVYPLKPPRMMRGFVDTASLIGPDPYELGISSGANQLAAMPSLHVGWALLVALSVIWISSSSMRWLILVHPIVTVAVVVLTANHYWTDAIAAVMIVGAAWMFTRALAAKHSVAFRSQPAVPRQPRVLEHQHQ